jgi:trigger factor
MMKVETQELPDSQVALSMEIDDERLEQAVDAAYRRVAGRVNIAGFRKGKAPRSLVERVIGREALLEEALEHLLPEAYEEALRISQVRALTEPEFDVESMTPLKAKATVVVPPPVELGDYRSIRHTLAAVDVEPSEVEAVLDDLRDSHAEWVPTERAAAIGDRVAIDVVGAADGKPFLKQDDVEYLLDEDNPMPVPGFAAQLVGMSAGDSRTFEIEVPADAESSFAGQKTEFQVAAKDVKAKELPELDDYFATTVGSYKDLEELRTQVNDQLRERSQLSSRLEHEAGVLKEAVDASTVVLPEKLVNHHAERLRQRLARELDSRGLSIEQYERMRRTSDGDLAAEFRADAERSLKRSLVLQAIAEQEGLTVADDQVDANIREVFSADGGNSRAAERALHQPEIRERVRTSLIEEQAAKWLVEHASDAPEAPQPESTDPEPEQPAKSPAPELQEQHP